MREPSQVFTLLETIFHEFDEIAHRRRVFKVETVGDCYVAVCGLPDPRKDHAVVMARFARDCLFRFNVVTKQLENLLGPDTSELGLRIGIHSGRTFFAVLSFVFSLIGYCGFVSHIVVTFRTFSGYGRRPSRRACSVPVVR
jgi:class 3 adenylate cyclase